MIPLRFDNVVRTFGGRRVLDGASGRAEAGRVVGLLARNGEGKTTLLKALLDLVAVDSGDIEVLGLRPDGSGDIRQRVGYVPERPVFHTFMDVGGVLALRARLFRNWSAPRAAALAARLGLDLGARVEGASKGTLGKLAWVCAAAHDPALYLLDEPTSGLDALVREEVLSGLVSELSESGKTVLVTSHRMDELAGLLDEVWVLAGGRIAATYALDDLRASARVVSGRLKEGGAVPQTPGALALDSASPVRAWAVFDDDARDRLLAAGGLDAPAVEPLPVDRALTYLLKHHGGDR